jgi:hypothetical protein
MIKISLIRKSPEQKIFFMKKIQAIPNINDFGFINPIGIKRYLKSEIEFLKKYILGIHNVNR